MQILHPLKGVRRAGHFLAVATQNADGMAIIRVRDVVIMHAEERRLKEEFFKLGITNQFRTSNDQMIIALSGLESNMKKEKATTHQGDDETNMTQASNKTCESDGPSGS